MARNAPTVMISSTYYDLKQIRKDLVGFIENDLGYNALASEFDTFPVDPDADTIENCRRRVEKEADILVLIIGGRYGFVNKKNNKSVTNLEYITARAKGIPIYAFVDRGILPLLPVWEKNPKAKFDPTVSDSKVFEFIKQVRSVDSVWTFDFEYAQDIVKALRAQFAHSMKEGLNLIQRMGSVKDPILSEVSGKSLRIILEKPAYWEFYLFAQVLTDEVSRHDSLREDHRYKLKFSIGENITRDNAASWLQDRNSELLRLAHTIGELLNLRLPEALGEDGVPGDPKRIVWVAKRIAEVYFHALNWSQRLRHVHTSEALRPVFELVVDFPNDIIEQIGGFGQRIISELDTAQLQPKGVTREVSITLNPTVTITPEYEDVLKECFRKAYEEE